MPFELHTTNHAALAHKRLALGEYTAQLESRGDAEALDRANHARAKIRSIDVDLAGTSRAVRSGGRQQICAAEQQLQDISAATAPRGTKLVQRRDSGTGARPIAASTWVREPATYSRHTARQRPSYVADLIRVNAHHDVDGSARERLLRHAQDVATLPEYAEYRDISRVDGSGGYAVPPAWLMDQYVELARPGRAMANLVNRQPLPAGTDSINIPKLLTGTSTGIQTADNNAVTDVDLTDTFINSPVRTIAGQQALSIQLIDQSPIAFDAVVFRDLVADHAAQVDRQVLNGTGSSGQVLGLSGTSGIQTVAASAVTTAGVYSAVANAVQLIHTTRFLAPEVIVMHPRRWGWFLSLLDGQQRPLFLPAANMPMNAAGVLESVASQQVVGQMHGLPVVTDPNISTTFGTETPTGTEDVIFVMRASDITLWESGIRTRVLPETKAQNLTVLLQIYSYVAFTAERYPASIVEISGLAAPSW
jgi:HK97 family phage major capsid protein